MLHGGQSISCWTGPQDEPHDFRFNKIEVEVKTTLLKQRIHIINGLDQLAPSIGHKLTLVSLQVTQAGDNSGESLSDIVNDIIEEAKLAKYHQNADSLIDLINSSGYRKEHSEFYRDSLVLRTLPRIIPVNQNLPSITKESLYNHIGNDISRIDNVQYRINVEGLGKEIKPDLILENLANSI